MPDWEIVTEGLRFPEGPVGMAEGSLLVVEIAGGRAERAGARARRQALCLQQWRVRLGRGVRRPAAAWHRPGLCGRADRAGGPDDRGGREALCQRPVSVAAARAG